MIAALTRSLYGSLSRPIAYRIVQRAVGATSSRPDIVARHVRPRPGDRILDIGCGTGDLVAALPAGVSYVGFDENADYIRDAQRRFGHRATFVNDRVERHALAAAGSFDVVLAFAVLHHLPDAAAHDLFRLARRALRPGGRLVTLDPCFTSEQSLASRLIVAADRGRHVRQVAEYADLARVTFPTLEVAVRHDLLRIPTATTLLDCRAEHGV